MAGTTEGQGDQTITSGVNAGEKSGGAQDAAGGAAGGEKDAKKAGVGAAAEDGQKGVAGDAAKGDLPKGKNDVPADIEVKLPEGVQADEAVLSAFKADAKASGMTSTQAQKMLDRYLAAQQAAAEKSDKDWDAQLKTWQQQARDDKEIGGEKYQANIAEAKKALVQFASPAFVKLLDDTGLTHHPEMIRFAFKVAKALGEDTIAGTGGGSSGNGLSPEEAQLRKLYPTMYQKKES